MAEEFDQGGLGEKSGPDTNRKKRVKYRYKDGRFVLIDPRRETFVILSRSVALIFLFASLAIGGFKLIDYFKVTRQFEKVESSILVIMISGSVLVIFMAVLLVLMRYLNTRRPYESAYPAREQIDELTRESEKAKSQSATAQVNITGKANIVAAPPDPKEVVFNVYREAQTRLTEEVQNTVKRANLNLGIGIASTIVGIIAFIIIIVITGNQLSDLIYTFLPRLSLVIFIQVFAYFFLRLYKKGMEDIKYFQNELTTLQSKEAAVKFTYTATECNVIQQSVVTQIAKDERNKVPKRDSNSEISSTAVVEKLLDFLKAWKQEEKH